MRMQAPDWVNKLVSNIEALAYNIRKCNLIGIELMAHLPYFITQTSAGSRVARCSTRAPKAICSSVPSIRSEIDLRYLI